MDAGICSSSQQVKRPGDQSLSRRLITSSLSSWGWSTGVIRPCVNLTSSTHQLFGLVQVMPLDGLHLGFLAFMRDTEWGGAGEVPVLRDSALGWWQLPSPRKAGVCPPPSPVTHICLSPIGFPHFSLGRKDKADLSVGSLSVEEKREMKMETITN